MSTTIRVDEPSLSGEAARALQLANQRRLEERELDAKATRDAARGVAQQIERGQALVGEGPWKGAVPEFDPVELALGKRFGKAFKVASAWWKYELVWDGSTTSSHAIIVSTGNREHTERIELPQVRFVSSSEIAYGPIWWLCLPAGGERLVLVFYSQVVNVDSEETGTLVPYEDILPYFPEDPGIEEPAYSFTFTEINTIGYVYSNLETGVTAKAAIVSPDGINIVDWPAGLKQQAEERFTFLADATIQNTTANTGFTKTYNYNVFPVYSSPGNFSHMESELTSYTETTEDRDVAAILAIYANDRRHDRDASVWLYLLRSYGYGRLVDRSLRAIGYEQDPGWGWTPAAFSYLKNYGGEFHVSSTDPSLAKFREEAANYKIIRDRYFPNDAPPILLTSGYQSEPAAIVGIDTTADYWYFKAPVVETASAVSTADFNASTLATSGSQLRRNGGATKQEPITSQLLSDSITANTTLGLSRTPQDGALVGWYDGVSTFNEIPVIAWDWGRQLACWLELQSLGFTASDLMLSDAEAEALAAADPVTAGFKF